MYLQLDHNLNTRNVNRRIVLVPFVRDSYVDMYTYIRDFKMN